MPARGPRSLKKADRPTHFNRVVYGWNGAEVLLGIDADGDIRICGPQGAVVTIAGHEAVHVINWLTEAVERNIVGDS